MFVTEGERNFSSGVSAFRLAPTLVTVKIMSNIVSP
jgi:hypothetical protein